MLFSQAPCGLFLPHDVFYLRAHWAQLWHYFHASLFHTTLTLPKRGFCVCGQNTRISTVPTCGIGLPFRSVWLFDTLFKRSKTHGRIFDFPSLKNRFPTKKAVFVSLSAAFTFCFLLTDFLGFYYLQTFAVWFTFESLYMFFVSFLCFAFGGAFPFGFISTLKQKFQSSKYFFSLASKNGSKMGVNARARGLFLFI